MRQESRFGAPLPAPALPRGAKARSGAAGLGARGGGAVAACSRKKRSRDALALPKLLCTTMRPRSQRLSCRCALSDCAHAAYAMSSDKDAPCALPALQVLFKVAEQHGAALHTWA